MSKKKDLVKIIRDNPGCFAVIDNDCWALYKQDPENNPHNQDGSEKGFAAFDKWETENLLADDSDVKPLGDGYGSGNCYGGDILQALAVIVGIKIESV